MSIISRSTKFVLYKNDNHSGSYRKSRSIPSAGALSCLEVQTLVPGLKYRFDRMAITQVINNGIPTRMEK